MFYQSRSSLAVEDQESDAEIMILLDGWINYMRVLGELITVYDVSPVAITFFLTQKHRFDDISATQTFDEPISTFATEDAFAIHGLPDTIPWVVLMAKTSAAGEYFDFQVFETIPLHAGHDLTFDHGSETLGSTNNTGEFDIIMECKQIIAREKWN